MRTIKATTFILLHPEVQKHPKTLALSAALGVTPVQALGHMIGLWTRTLANEPMGVLWKWDADLVAWATDWSGDPALMVDALLAVRLMHRYGIDQCPCMEDVGPAEVGTFVLHEWVQHNSHEGFDAFIEEEG